ncbi:MAG: YceI family protein [Bacteroidales bacterium]|nr:YceI family protein [Bacteroidales bacterium]
MKKLAILSLLVVLATSTFAQKKYTQDKYHSKLIFGVTHLKISDVEGKFKSFDATATASKADFTDAQVSLKVDVNSIDTDIEYRDKHLKSPDFFDAEKFPTIDFKSSSFKKVAPKKYKMAGTLTMHGVSKPIVFDVVYNGSAQTMDKKTNHGFAVTGKLNRLDFGIAPSMANAMVSNEITLKANIEFTEE